VAAAELPRQTMRLFLYTTVTLFAWLAAAAARAETTAAASPGQSLSLLPPETSVEFDGKSPTEFESTSVARYAAAPNFIDAAPPDGNLEGVLPTPMDVTSGSGETGDASSEYSAEHENEHGPYYTTGAPFPGDGGMFFCFPEDPPSRCEQVVNFVPGLLTHPNDTFGDCWAKLLCAERDELHTELDEEAIGIQYVAPRPPLLVECNEYFLGPGELARGIEFGPLGPVVRPAFWVWGEHRSAVQYFDAGNDNAIFEQANRLDLFAQLNLTGTERFLFAARPLDRENKLGTGREFVSYDFGSEDWLPGANFQPQSAFFEGDFGELFPMLDPYDSEFLDIGFSVGRMPLLAQQGLLINEDTIDAVTVTRNTVNNGANLNQRITGVFAWNELNRNSPVAPNPGVMIDHNSKMFAVLTETDFFRSTVNADAAYVTGDDVHGDLVVAGLSSIQRHYFHHNTYNTSLHALASFPTDETTPYAEQGELFFAQTSWTPHHYYDLIYVNGFFALDQFTSPARAPATASPIGLTGIGFAPVALGRSGPPMAVRSDDTYGGAIGYQWFFDKLRKQLIWEVGGAKDHAGPSNRGVLGTILSYQSAHGQHTIFVLDGFVAKQEANDSVATGGRAEIRLKF
jgi:hypothetical protein